MLRIANPGSDISTFIRIYIELYEALGNRESFGLDDFSETLIERNLATSCGFMGQEALARSTRQDRSRDPLYNQSKMYSELYKVLGWLHPLPDSALTFRFTYLGAHILEVRRSPSAFFKECLLGIAYPNAILNIGGNYALRPFATILRTMADLDGLICRDEIIFGPLCLEDDRNNRKFSEMVKKVKSIRGNWKKLQKELGVLSATRKISKQTRENYTRFPIAALKWTGWVKTERRSDIYGRSIPILILTDEGQKTVENIKSSLDIRAKDLTNLGEEEKAALVRLGFYQMLGRAGFEIDPLSKQLSQDLRKVRRVVGESSVPILFSPFQEIEPDYARKLFPQLTMAGKIQKAPHQATKSIAQPTVTTPRISTTITPGSSAKTSTVGSKMEIAKLFNKAFQKTNNVEKAVEMITENLVNWNKDKFYPFVASLFCALGYDCQHSRPGVNYERWDAIIVDLHNSIPIEIKSPGEEEFISIKAVRQALENKVILMARNAFPTKQKTTSLVVGYNLPNDRSEVTALIDNIRNAYNVNIGVIDARSLLRLAAATVFQGKKHNPNELITLRGIINVPNS